MTYEELQQATDQIGTTYSNKIIAERLEAITEYMQMHNYIDTTNGDADRIAHGLAVLVTKDIGLPQEAWFSHYDTFMKYIKQHQRGSFK